MPALRALAAALLLAVAMATAACEAPLKPKSQQADGSARASASPSPSVRPRPPRPSRPAHSAPATSTGPARPHLTVPRITAPRAPSVPVLGGDASWPQCPKGMGIPQKQGQGSPMPLDSARFVLLGLTNGPGFHPNPCLASQVAWVRGRHLLAAAYSVISTPQAGDLSRYGRQGPFDGSTRLGALSNVGYQEAKFNLATMKRAGLLSPIIWLDIEPVPDFDWPPDPTANAAVVSGAAKGYADAGYPVGAYSTQALWQHVVGGLVLRVPEWRPAGGTSRDEALRRCGQDRMFQGGHAVLAQWVEAGRDLNVTCPGTSSEMLRWFHQY